MTPSQFYAEYLNKAVDFDGAYGAQCVDGFRVWGQFNGVSIPPTPNNWADGYWYYRDQLFKDRFDFVLEPDRFSDGDWVIWARGSKSHPNSHIAMFYHGQEFGENQGGKNGAFNLKQTDFSDALGALRWKGYEKMIIEKGFHEISWNGITVDILRATKSSGYDLHLISAGDAFAVKDFMSFDSDKLAIVGAVNANYFDNEPTSQTRGMHLGVEADGFVQGYTQAPKLPGIQTFYVTDQGTIGARDQSGYWLEQEQVQVACAPYSVRIHQGNAVNNISTSFQNKENLKTNQTAVLKIGDDWCLAIFGECFPSDVARFATEAGATECVLMDSGGSSQMFECATTGTRKAVRVTGRLLPNVLVLAKEINEKGDTPGLSDAVSQTPPETDQSELPEEPSPIEEKDMNKIDWKRKLSSRKFWAAIAGLVTGVAAAFGMAESESTQITGIIMAVGSLIAYILSEGWVDASRESSNE